MSYQFSLFDKNHIWSQLTHHFHRILILNMGGVFPPIFKIQDPSSAQAEVVGR
jgi:hypothetical protein